MPGRGVRRGRPVRFRTTALPPGSAGGLWLDMTDQDLALVQERTAPENQLAILGQEPCHMRAGHHGHHVDAAGVATRLVDDGADLRVAVPHAAARSRFDLAEEEDKEEAAESLPLLPAGKCRTWPVGSSLRGPVRRDVRPGGSRRPSVAWGGGWRGTARAGTGRRRKGSGVPGV
ncbi:hypothetical protein TNCT6_07020 [Streptomyces sp. 6-11-2]|nr:hypothetical protein TNCT6_07020 [Streptomyces sp. 6-11-2]